MSTMDLFNSMAIINYIPNKFIGDEGVDYMIYTTVLFGVLCVFNVDRAIDIYTRYVRYMHPVSESRITFEAGDSYFMSTYYLGVIKYYSKIKVLTKSANNSNMVYEIGGCNVLIHDDIYFTTSEKENTDKKRKVATLTIHSKTPANNSRIIAEH
jgi:hypothetical protein